ncbi:hypothetical protein EJ05DRAFT_93427 [Pseudovirgaria hyperparasitica]|uniref:Uncharacterized protein n=1 Tax=Pseudovirgaria hyperparasitica TaxID=470096 RepID=A0A6A6W2D6_9PEZI|nr:uncharacterized protein EJ05DRAFT_93427 [Pseudovirgaria hyperparasitica]KAF2756206.1 hypothetical protein EJ05DRAFT_93427 [Pseudovirgaria hyperparasitica]
MPHFYLATPPAPPSKLVPQPHPNLSVYQPHPATFDEYLNHINCIFTRSLQSICKSPLQIF